MPRKTTEEKKAAYDEYRKEIRRFTLQFSRPDIEAREWFEKQQEPGAYLKNLIMKDKRENEGGVVFTEKASRNIEGYEIIQSIQIGVREIVVGVDERGQYMCAYYTCMKYPPSCTDMVFENNYLKIMEIFSTRLSKQVQTLLAEQKNRHIPSTVVTEEQCDSCHLEEDLSGKIIAIRPDALRHEYRRADRQLIYVTQKVGSREKNKDTDVYGINIYTGKSYGKWARSDILGVVRPENLPPWVDDKLKSIERRLKLEKNDKTR